MKPGASAEETTEERSKKVKTCAEAVDSVADWSQEQQKALEAALIKYPKNTLVNRWEKIANCVEGKTKVRYSSFTPFSCIVDFIAYGTFQRTSAK